MPPDTPAGTETTGTPATAGTQPAAEPAANPTPSAEPAANPAPAAEPPANPASNPAPAEPEGKPEGKDDWAATRTRIAGGDEKLEKRLARYSSVDGVVEALIAAQNKIASGGLKQALPADATPEQLAEWRAENGIPAAPEEYDTTLPDGLVIGEEDKPIVDEYLAAAHANNLTPDQVKANLAWYFENVEKQIEARAQEDVRIRDASEEALREVWGSEAKLNKGIINNLLSTAPAGVAEQLLGARMADGTPFGSHVDTLRWLADVSRQLNPVATVVPGAGTNAVQQIESEIAGLEKMMANKTSEYWKGPMAEKNQARYRDLISAKQKIG